MWVDDEFLHGEWRADEAPSETCRIVEKDHHFKHEFWGGCSRHNKLYRETYNLDGTLLHEEFVTENNALMMYSPFLEGDHAEREK